MILYRRFSKILELFLGFITAFSWILLSSPSLAITPDDIDAMSSQTTVLIGQLFKGSDGVRETFNPGSGVIVSRNGNTYYVITNNHVVKEPNSENIWGVVTWDQKFHEVGDVGDNIIRFGNYQSPDLPIRGFDLALIKFTADDDYPIAVMGNSKQMKVNDPIYLSGWPKPEGGVAGTVRVFSAGRLVKIDDTPSENGGYNIMYNNWTKPGMSGSPIFNQNGELIGIHAAGRRKWINYCIDPKLNFKSSCGIEVSHFLSQIEAKQITLAFSLPPVSPWVITKARQNKAKAYTIEDVYKRYRTSRQSTNKSVIE